MKRLVPERVTALRDEALRAARRGADRAALGGDLRDVELVDFRRQVTEQRIRDVHAVEQVHVVLPAAAAVRREPAVVGDAGNQLHQAQVAAIERQILDEVALVVEVHFRGLHVDPRNGRGDR